MVMKMLRVMAMMMVMQMLTKIKMTMITTVGINTTIIMISKITMDAPCLWPHGVLDRNALHMCEAVPERSEAVHARCKAKESELADGSLQRQEACERAKKLLQLSEAAGRWSASTARPDGLIMILMK